jgi:tellurite resistance protein TehA-like permease
MLASEVMAAAGPAPKLAEAAAAAGPRRPRRTAALQYSEDLPTGVAGVALGCAAFSNLLHALYAPARPVVIAAALLSAFICVFFIAARIVKPHRVCAEAMKPRTFFPYGAWEMALAFAWARLLPDYCAPGAYAAGALQLAILLTFLRACCKTRAAPAPYWNPVCMSCAATTIVGAPCLGARHWLPLFSFGLALVSCVIIAPPEAWAVLGDASESPGADVALLAAPCSIAAAAFAALKQAADGPVLWDFTADACVGGLLVGLATLYAAFAVFAVWRRRRTVRPFSLVWATMTFPAAITCVVWLQYAEKLYFLWAARVVAGLVLLGIAAIVGGCFRLALLALLDVRRWSSSELSLSRV